MSDDRIAGLAREQEQHGRRIKKLEDAAEAVPQMLAELADRVEAVADSPAGSDEADEKEQLISWFELVDEPATARREMAALVEWLGMVFVHYHDADKALGTCWPWHPDAVEQLRALRWAWSEAYATGSGRAIADWHDRLLPGVIERLRKSIGECGIEKHTHGREADKLAPHVPAADATEGLAQWWAETGGHGGAPKPTEAHLAAVRADARLY